MTDLKAIQGAGRGQDVAGEMAARILAVIADYEGRVPLALAVGVLDIVKAELMVNND